MTTLIVLSSIFLYVLIGAVVGQVWERMAQKRCNDYNHAYCEHFILAILAGILWPVFPPVLLFILGGIKLATGITNLILGKED